MKISTCLPRSLFALALIACASPAAVVAAQEIVQPPTPRADDLAEQMRVLAREPENHEALVKAGLLSVRLGEPQAALQFLQRAEDVAPDDPRIAAGRAGAYVLLQRPGEALRLFAQAERQGLDPVEYAADRGLAYDLTGHPRLAQADYRLALTRGEDSEIVRRLALSLGISGDRKEAEKLLDKQLRAQNRTAWRAQAFVLAMDGDIGGAENIATTLLPDVGASFRPFFRRLENMAPADRAFAVHFGQLTRTPQQIADAKLAPPVAETGENERIASKAATRTAQPARHARKGKRGEQEAQAQQNTIPVHLVDVPPARADKPETTANAPLVQTAMTAPRKVESAPAGPSAKIGAEDDSIARIRNAAAPGSSANAEVSSNTATATTDRAATAPATPTAKAAPRKDAPEKAASSSKKRDPSRHWVQVAGGANKDALPREWERLAEKAPVLFEGRKAWTTPLRFTNRLLAGPFDSDAEAQDFVNKLASEGLSAFTFTSDTGQAVERLETK